MEESGDTSWVERSGVSIALRDRVWQLSGMPRRPRLAMGGLAYQVLNRAVGRGTLFEKAADYEAFERVLEQAWARLGTRILGAYKDSRSL